MWADNHDRPDLQWLKKLSTCPGRSLGQGLKNSESYSKVNITIRNAVVKF